MERAETAVDLAGADFIPQVDLVASYLRPFDAEFIPDEFARVGVEARWEFFAWGRRADELAGKRAGVRKAQNKERSIRAKVELEVSEQLRNLRDAETAVPVIELAERAAQEKRDVMMNRYKEQDVLLQRVLEAEAELAEAKAGVRISKLEVLAAQADLERAMGQE